MSLTPVRRHYGLIFIVSMLLLMLEIATARVLSVSLPSHYAFVAISLAMFGLGLGGLCVYLFFHHFPAERLDRQLVDFTWRFGLAAALCMAVYVRIPIVPELSVLATVALSVAYAVLAIPFFLGGVCIALMMTHFSASIGRIYAADLLGASLGCLGVVAAMELFSAPQVSLLVAGIASVTAVWMSTRVANARPLMPILSVVVVFALVALSGTYRLYTLRYVKNWPDYYSDYEAWNAFSRVSAFIYGGTSAQTLPLKGSPLDYAERGIPETMMLDIDGTAWTPMFQFNGDVKTVDFLRESVNYIAHHIRPSARVLIIGTGGGRDLLAAHVFGQPSVLGIELNPLMRHVVEDVYGDYSGRPYTRIGAEVIIDEARSRLATLDQRFDIIQLSLIDTFSLNASGGFVFSENYLYTQEAFQEYFRHLTDQGVLSVTRYFVPKYPIEVLRLIAMTKAAWKAEGVADAANHIVVLNQGLNGTILAKRSPFTPEELERLDALAREYNITVLYRPGKTDGHAAITELMTTADVQGVFDRSDFLIGPSTDDRPFFFHFLRARMADVPSVADDHFQVLFQWNRALSMMYLLIAIVTGMAALFFFGPLLLLGRRGTIEVPGRVAAPLLLYFACLGYGFMIIEIPLMQRLILFLGYPVYALAVVLFALLVFSGIGSLLTARFRGAARDTIVRVLLGIVAISIVYAFYLPHPIAAMMGMPIAAKIAVSVLVLAPIGLILGMAYPLGITILRGFGEGLVPWAWALNGALSVVASVLAIFISSRVGFTVTMLSGTATYAVALLCVLVVRQAVTERVPVPVARTAPTRGVAAAR